MPRDRAAVWEEEESGLLQHPPPLPPTDSIQQDQLLHTKLLKRLVQDSFFYFSQSFTFFETSGAFCLPSELQTATVSPDVLSPHTSELNHHDKNTNQSLSLSTCERLTAMTCTRMK